MVYIVCVCVCAQILLHICEDTVTINHPTKIQFPHSEFYYMGTRNEFAIISLQSY